MITTINVLPAFMSNAFWAGTILSIVAAVVGYFVVLRAQAFAAHALAHVGFAGATGAIIFGLSSLWGTLVFTTLAAVGMGALGKRLRGRDVEVGMMLSFALGLGVLFLHVYTTSASETATVLFGSLLSMTTQDVHTITVLSIVVLASIFALFRPLLFSSLDPEVASARGVPSTLLNILFMIILGITVAQTMQVVGTLLVFALLVVPAAIAQHITKRPLMTILVAVAFGLLFTWSGIAIAILLPVPVSFVIATLAAASYGTIVSLCHHRRPHTQSVPVHPDHEFRLT